MFIGAMPGTVGYGHSGELVQALRKSPQGVILLDEIDKAVPEALDVLLHLFGDARTIHNNYMVGTDDLLGLH
jgi:ATP-dependent Clp protease ATP-binding subunit ClpB